MTLLQKYKIQVAGAVIVVDKKKSEEPFNIGERCDNFLPIVVKKIVMLKVKIVIMGK